eukprot:m.191289 g.191289  ORF g.191289 m.191289 type:complete len:316 (-) comp32423_c0_seq1:140-1087(-)
MEDGGEKIAQFLEMGGDEYESLPGQQSPLIHALAGSVAGICEHTFAFPLDVVKTRLQRLRPSPEARYRGVLDAFRKIVRREGRGSLFRGFGAVAVGAGPAHAVYFASYEQAKYSLGISDDPSKSPYATALAGIVATFTHEATMNPIEVVKQRLQMHGSVYKSPMDCVRSVYREEGIRAFYRSLTTNVIMSVPYQTIHLVTYETLREKVNPSGEYNPTTHLAAGAGAGAVAAAITNPFDVMKTLLNTQEKGIEKSHMDGVRSAFRTIHQVSGWRGFAKGMSARVTMAAPGTAVSWCVYEFFKHTLHTDLDQPQTCC